MATFHTQKFVDAQLAKGRSPEEISSFLESKGFDAGKESQTFSQGVGGKLLGAGKSFLQGTQAVARGAQTAGQGILAFLDPTKSYAQVREQTGLKSLKSETPEGAGVIESVTPRGPDEQFGAKAETVAEFVVPGAVALRGSRLAAGVPKVVGAMAGGAKKVVPMVGKAAETASEVAMGTKNVQAVKQAFKAPKDVAAFRTGKGTIQDIADRTGEAIDVVRNASKGKFDAVIERLPGNKVSRSSTIEQLRSDIVENLGISGKKLTLRNLKDSGMSDSEASNVLRLFNRVKAHGDWTDRGLVKLRQALDKGGFYKPGNEDYRASNKIVGRIRKALNEAAGNASGDDALKGALKEASDDIDLIEQMGYALRGTNADRNVEAAAQRLEGLIGKLGDPTKREATKKLLVQLKERTGLDAEELLQSLSSGRAASADLPGFIKSPLETTQQLVGRGINRASEFAGRVAGQQPESQLFKPVKAPQPFRTGEAPPLPRAGGSKKAFREAIDARRAAAIKDIVERRARP